MTPELSHFFAGAKSLGDLLRLAVERSDRPAPAQLWKRCALVSQFDAAVYAVLTADLGVSTVPGFAEFVALEGVEAVSPPAGAGSPASAPTRYRLKSSARERHGTTWEKDDPDLVQTSARLVEYFTSQGRDEEAFVHRLFADPAAALVEFRRRYAEADQAFDLGRCESLLQLLRARYRLLAAPLQHALNDREQYLQSRALFAADFYGTVSFLERDDLRGAFDVFWGLPERWILPVFGGGGLGKTMFVRWLTARHCVPEREGRRIPVARADLDFLDLSLLADHPWLLLIHWALQLRPQLVSSPFQTLLGPDAHRMADWLQKRLGPLSREDLLNLQDLARQTQRVIEDQFAVGLGVAPTFLILDTLEEVSLYRPTVLGRILTMLAGIRTRCPGLKVLLSGRYDPWDPSRVPNLQLDPETTADLRAATSQIPLVEVPLAVADLIDLSALQAALAARTTPVEAWLSDRLQSDPELPTGTTEPALFVAALNRVIGGTGIGSAEPFADVTLRPETRVLLEEATQAGSVTGGSCLRLNRMLIEDAFPKVFRRDLGLHPLSAVQARDFLVRLRRLPADRPIDAILAKSNGIPFKLSLFADLAMSRPLLTQQDVESCPDTDFAYLIERVIDRIPNEQIRETDREETVRRKQILKGVRWLLRYAVIPRRLTLEFTREVLAGFLLAEISGQSRRDNVESTSSIGYGSHARWERFAGDVLVDDIWAALGQYASDHTWIHRDGDALALQPEVVVPMRRLLRLDSERYPIHEDLHRAAQQYYEKRSRDEAGRRGSNLAEALYHAVQVSAHEGAVLWKRSRERWPWISPAILREVAESLLTKDYLDDQGRPVLRDATTPFITPRWLGEAAYIAAQARMLEALGTFSPPSSSTPALLRQRLEEHARFSRDEPEPIVHPDRLELVRVALQVFEALNRRRLVDPNTAPAAAPTLDPATVASLESLPRRLRDRLDRIAIRLLRLWAGVPLDLGSDRRAWTQYVEVAKNTRFEPVLAGLTAERLIIHGRPEWAWPLLGRAMTAALDGRTSVTDLSEILLRLSDLGDALGLEAEVARQARRIAGQPGQHGFPAHEQAMAICVRAALERLQLPRARLLLSQLSTKHPPIALELRADLAAAELDLQEAATGYRAAQSGYLSVGMHNSATQVHLKLVRLLLDLVGSLPEARGLLHQLTRFSEPIHQAEYFSLALRIRQADGDESGAREVLVQWLTFLARTPALPPTFRAQALATALAEGLPDPEIPEQFTTLLAALPGEARYVALRPFRSAAPGRTAASSVDLLRLVPIPEPTAEHLPHAINLLAAALYFRKPGSAESTEFVREVAASLLRGRKDSAAFRLAARLYCPRAGEELGGILCPTGKRWAELLELPPGLRAAASLWDADVALDRKDFATATQLLVDLDRTTGTMLTNPSRWRLLDLELQARRLAQANERSATASTLSAALELARQLGETRAVERLTARREVQTPAPATAPPPFEAPAFILEIGTVQSPSDGRRVSIQTRRIEAGIATAGPSADQITGPTFPALLQAVGDLYPESLVSLLRSDPRQVQHDLTQLLAASGNTAAPSLELRIPLGDLSAVPWELGAAATPGARVHRGLNRERPRTLSVRWLQRALGTIGEKLTADGVWGPQTSAAWARFRGPESSAVAAIEKLRALPSLAPGARPPVLLMQADEEVERFHKRGHGVLGISLERLYRSHGIEVVKAHRARELVRLLPELRPVVVHIACAFSESWNPRSVFLDLGEGDSEPNREKAYHDPPISPEVLASALKSGLRTDAPPVIILEVYYDPEDEVRQVFLRNAFAAALFEQLEVRAILAAGAARFEAVEELTIALIQGVRDSVSLGDLHERLWRHPGVLLPPALFCPEVGLPVWDPR